MEKYQFREYISKYKKFFLKEKNAITKALLGNCFIEHVGSTSVPGLGGKGIVDVLVSVKSKNLHPFIKTLESVGYEFREKASTPDRFFFRRDYKFSKETRRVHIHLTKFDSKDWNEMIAFRNYLLKYPEDVKKYVKIKKEAVERAKGEGEIYREFKRSFMEDITKKQLAINELRKKVQEIVKIATTLKNKHTSNKNAPVNYACIFSHSQKEYGELIRITQSIGKIVKETPTGLLFWIWTAPLFIDNQLANI